MLALLAQMSSMVADGLDGANSESSTTVSLPPSRSSKALLLPVARPRNTQFRNVMFLPVTLTKPWKSLPTMTSPLPEKVWSPVTTASEVPFGTPVLPAAGGPTGRGAAAGFVLPLGFAVVVVVRVVVVGAAGPDGGMS